MPCSASSNSFLTRPRLVPFSHTAAPARRPHTRLSHGSPQSCRSRRAFRWTRCCVAIASKCGSRRRAPVTFDVVDAAGEPFDVAGGFVLSGVGDTAFASLPPRIETTSGTGVFEYVALGLRLDVRFWASGAELTGGVRTFDGPTRARRNVRIPIVAGSPRAAVVGRLVDADEVPMPNAWVSVRVHDPKSTRNWQPGDSDQVQSQNDGRFVAQFDAAPHDLEGATLTAYIGEVQLIRRDVSAWPLSGELDLGDVRVAPDEVPLVVAGSVAVAGSDASVVGLPVGVERRTRGGRWTAVSGLRGHVDAEGRFAIRGKPVEGVTRVTTWHPQLVVVARDEFTHGATDVAPPARGGRPRLRACRLAVDDASRPLDRGVARSPYGQGGRRRRRLLQPRHVHDRSRRGRNLRPRRARVPQVDPDVRVGGNSGGRRCAESRRRLAATLRCPSSDADIDHRFGTRRAGGMGPRPRPGTRR